MDTIIAKALGLIDCDSHTTIMQEEPISHNANCNIIQLRQAAIQWLENCSSGVSYRYLHVF